jgi:hypothetical protein
MSDPIYIAEGERLGLPMDPAPGDRVEVMVKQALAQSPEMIALLKIAASEQ